MSVLVSVRDVVAHWAYSEILRSHTSMFYDNVPGIAALRKQRRASTPFDRLSERERILLAEAWRMVRSFFAPYLRDVRGYRVERWNKRQLLCVRVPKPIAPDHPLLADFIFTPCADARDARNADRETGFSRTDDPLTLGLLKSEYVLGDGFHRCKRFLVCAGAEDTLPVYVPMQ